MPLWILTNDDGIDAPGLAALGRAARGLAPDACRVYAPLGHHSGCSHTVTTHAPIAVADLAADRASVAGTPADCVRVALHRLGDQVGWVLSGVNAGGNLGADVPISGTVAAVREAAFHGVPGIALSHYIKRGRPVDWDKAALRAARVIAALIDRPPGPGAFWNVNLPHPGPDEPEPELVFCPVDASPLPLDYRDGPGGLVYCGDYQSRPRRPGCDVDVCFGGRISVSRVAAVGSLDAAD